MSKFKSCCTAVIMLFSVMAAKAQLSTPVTLNELLNKVSQNAPSLLKDSASIRIRQAEAAEVRGYRLPNFKLNYQADIGSSNNTTGPYFGFGIIPSSSGGIHPTNNTTAMTDNLGIAAFDWEIYNFGVYRAENKVANSNITVERNSFAQSKYQIQAYAIGNYLQLLRLQHYIAIQLLNIQRNTEIRRSVQSLAKSGVRAGVDTSIAEAELSKSRLNYIELDNQMKLVQLQLSALSGLPYRSVIADTTAENKLIERSIAARLSIADTANHPLINYYRSLYQNDLLREDLVKKQYNPKIMFEAAGWTRGSSVDATGRYNSLSNGFGFDRDNYLVGIGISYNVFDLRRKALKLRTQKAITTYAERELDEQRQLLALNNDKADVDLNTALKRLQEIPKQLKAANDGYRQKLSLYKSGLTDIIELNAALNILYRAETDYVQAKYAYSNALFQKAFTQNQVNSVLNLLN